ncbi:MAG: hypothetical protein VX438_02880, partial [Planctomycetota bacterium]|nr:hypothetical protein [Planctomycetota bacterium]
DTVYDREQDPAKEFKESRNLTLGSRSLGKHGDGLIFTHFDADDSEYGKADLDDEDELLKVKEKKLGTGEDYQVLNYATIEQVNVFGGPGNDRFISDDTSEVMNVYGNEGDDQFFVGSILKTKLVWVEGREIAVVESITHGASYEMKFYGGDGEDYFEVNHNKADIELYGDNGDDTFFVKALLTINEDDDVVEIDNKTATVSGASGEGSESDQKGNNDTREVDIDALVYVENANIKIDGGSGFDSIAIVGTVLSDTFHVFTETNDDGETVQRIFGAGVKLKELFNIERVQLITGPGDDRVYLYGVNLGSLADFVVNTGTGSDLVYVGGPELQFDLNYPTRKTTQFASVDGFLEGIEKEIAYGTTISEIDRTNRIVPFDVEEPAGVESKTVAASAALVGILNPVVINDPDGLVDSVVFRNELGPVNIEFFDRQLKKKNIDVDASKLSYPEGQVESGLTDLVGE